MALNLENKKAIVAEVTEQAKQSISVVAAEYRGLTVGQMTELRKSAREAGVYMRVIRNTLARRALADTAFACLDEKLTGPLFLAFSKHELGTAARLIRDFGKKNDKLQVTALAYEGQLHPASALALLADLPTKPEAIATLMAVMKEPVAKLARTLQAIKDAKEANSASA